MDVGGAMGRVLHECGQEASAHQRRQQHCQDCMWGLPQPCAQLVLPLISDTGTGWSVRLCRLSNRVRSALKQSQAFLSDAIPENIGHGCMGCLDPLLAGNGIARACSLSAHHGLRHSACPPNAHMHAGKARCLPGESMTMGSSAMAPPHTRPHPRRSWGWKTCALPTLLLAAGIRSRCLILEVRLLIASGDHCKGTMLKARCLACKGEESRDVPWPGGLAAM